MKTIRVNLKKRSYDIVIGKNIIESLGAYIIKLNIGDTAYVITNSLIKNKYGDRLSRALKSAGFDLIYKTVPDTERSKSIKVSTEVLMDIGSQDRRRRIFIIAFGGGVIGDLAGFIASIYKRGISYIQLPTTLLAQVDSSIGGKTAVDLTEGKNLVGAFYQPKLVFSDINFLNTLTRKEILSGLSEVIKYAVIKDEQLFRFLEGNYKDILSLKPVALKNIIYRCSLIKAKVVEKDEREEEGIRTILNFGHTIGHAIEAASNYKRYTHGEAIALGMLVALDISNELNLIKKATVSRIEGLIKTVGLPTKIRFLSVESIIKAHYRDKKFIGTKNRFVLIKNLAKTEIVESIPLKVIRRAIKKRL